MTGEIVLGYDASLCADAALETAIGLASGLGCALVVAYVSEPPNPSVGEERAEVRRALEELERPPAEAAAERARASGVEAEVVVAEGRRPADALSELATSRGARMIVVGTTSERPLAGIVLGSVPYRLLHRSRVPVLVVPLHAEHG